MTHRAYKAFPHALLHGNDTHSVRDKEQLGKKCCCWEISVCHNEWPTSRCDLWLLTLSPSLWPLRYTRKGLLKGFPEPTGPWKCGQSPHFLCISMALLLAQGFWTKARSVSVRYKRKGLRQVGHSLVQEQEEQQKQQPTDQQNDFHWNEHDEQGELSLT